MSGTTRRRPRRSWRIGIGVIGGLLVAGCSDTTIPPTSAASTQAVAVTSSTVPAVDPAIGALTEIAKDAAVRDGDPGVHTAQVVLTTIRAAMALRQPGDYSAMIDGQIYVIGMSGTFVLRHIGCPLQLPPPATTDPDRCTARGTHLYLGVDAKSLQENGVSLGSQARDLAKLGPVQTLRW